MKNIKVNALEILKQLRSGKEVVCPECKKGKLVTKYDYRTSHSFQCTECGLNMIID